MRIILFLLAVILFPVFSHADCMQKAEVANSFMNEYKMYSDTVINAKTNETAIQWVRRNPMVTNSFRKTHRKIVLHEAGYDPEMVSDYDPVFNAEDSPEKGFLVHWCDDKSNYVTLKGVDWDAFRVVVKVIRTKKGWLIDGAGAVNIPVNKRVGGY
jgi:hypothetical protein